MSSASSSSSVKSASGFSPMRIFRSQVVRAASAILRITPMRSAFLGSDARRDREQPLDEVLRVLAELGEHDAHARWVVLHRSEEHTSELQSRENRVCRLLLEKK